MISFESPEPHLASLVVNHTVDAYMEEINRMKAETSRSSVKYMNQKAAGEEQKLKKGEQGLQDYIEKNDMLTLENRLAVIPEKLSRIATELVSAEARRKELEVLTAKVGRVATDPEAAESVSQVLSDQALQSLRAQIVMAEKKHPGVVRQIWPETSGHAQSRGGPGDSQEEEESGDQPHRPFHPQRL